MVTGTLRRQGDTYVIDVRSEDIERYGLRDGQEVTITLPGETPVLDEAGATEVERRAWWELGRRSLARGWSEADRAYEQLL